ncbi:MAG: L-serine ammonia-lyase [Erysipelotrichaceae bacterium]|nr:MAG: L-serine [Erysipelotrichaceae bacterium]TXT17275.1 MAG: L-serine ammonia-lyase [Erysipelotrichaceae bacterium]
MESLRELYKVGPGPSSSHTIAPWKAALLFKEAFPDAVSYDAELYGSLSLTGKGHFTDQIIIQTFAPKMCKVYFRLHWEHLYENGLIYKAYDERNNLIGLWTIFSLGGGSIRVLEQNFDFQRTIYPYPDWESVAKDCKSMHLGLPALIRFYEPDIEPYLEKILETMLKTVKRGLDRTGTLPGLLEINRIAKSLYLQAENQDSETSRNRLKVLSYAYANNEENASGGMVVTAPTCGASGVLAALMMHYYYDLGYSKQKLVQSLMVGGMFGNIVKMNATISGAVGGCQAEIGTACSMAAAATAYLHDLSLKQIENAAEIAMEHHLGLTCDPVGGYVIIPCIERNGAAALRAIDAAFMAEHLGSIKDNKISFDMVVRTMNYTGKKIVLELRETALGGLATELRIDPRQK